MKRIRILLFALLIGWAGAAQAQMQIHFYSKDLASTFPHAFVRLTGTVESTGAQIDDNYGFTPERLAPGILFTPVRGMIQSLEFDYIARSDRHFSLALTEEQYRSVLAIVARWRDAPQPNYRLNSRNCVHFVAEVAQALGLSAPEIRGLMKKPRSYLEKITRDNLALIERWATNHVPPGQVERPAESAASVAASPTR